jgi:23S rRNA (cytosine1962-C5)-methyltransferase
MAELQLTDAGNEKRKNEDWVLYRGDVRDDADVDGGDVVDLLDEGGNYRGRGFYSDRGSVAVHVVANGKREVDRSFFHERLERALSLRQGWAKDRLSYRLVNGSGDFLPGLVVDRYGEYLSVQLRSQAMDRRRDTIVEVLDELCSPSAVYHRGDTSIREQLGLPTTSERLAGESIPELVTVQESPYVILADLKEGQKTGYYLDQADNRRQLHSVEEPGEGLDCFSYSGAWGLAMLWAGAESVTFVDRSRRALELVRENLDANGWTDRAEMIKEDGFDYLEGALDRDERYDTVVLDPPAFAKSEDQYGQARAGYKGINFRAMRLLKPSGLLATSSCSHPVDMERFTGIVRESAHDAHVACQILQRRQQSPDHPWLADDPAPGT